MTSKPTAQSTSNNGIDEREFLHDLATPIGTALFLADCMMDRLQSRLDVDPEEKTELTKIYEALEKITKMLYQRREILIARGVPSARS